MFHDILAWDRAVTLWINQHHHVILDIILTPVSLFGEGGWGWIIIALLLLIFGRRKERIATACFAVGLVVTEFLLMPELRDLWMRPRPYTYMEGIRTLGVEWPHPSFPSAHMHLWAQATIVYGLLYRRWLWPLVILAVLTGYSRPYAGMHHVIDVFGGAALGGVMGTLELYTARHFLPPDTSDEPAPEDDESPDHVAAQSESGG